MLYVAVPLLYMYLSCNYLYNLSIELSSRHTPETLNRIFTFLELDPGSATFAPQEDKRLRQLDQLGNLPEVFYYFFTVIKKEY